MRLKDDILFVPLNWNSPFSSLQLWREPTTLNTSLILSSCNWALEHISRLISDTPRTRPTDEADPSPLPLPPLESFVRSLEALTCGATSSDIWPEARLLRMAVGPCDVPIPMPLLPDKSPAGVVRRRTATRSLALDESMAVAPREREMVVCTEGASPTTASRLRRVGAVVVPFSTSICLRPRVTRG